MNMTKGCLTFAILLAMMFISCSDSGADDASDDGVSVSKTFLAVSPANLSYGSGGETKEISVSCNTSWQVDLGCLWLTIDKSNGIGNATIRITAMANTGTKRQTVISFSSGENEEITRTCTLTQDASDSQTDSPSGGTDTPSTGVVAVDLGLSSGTKWANMNVGASSAEDYGDYYAWGETTTKSEYTFSNSATYGLSMSELQSKGITDSSGDLTTSYDVAAVKWGGSWRMPTWEQISELLSSCTWTWTAQNEVNGYKVSGTNGNSIFLPAAGYRSGGSLYYAGSYGLYWSATCNASYANGLNFNAGGHYLNNNYRNNGRSVRPVSE